MKTLLITADDFGRTVAVNDAIERYHVAGAVTRTSLMVNEPAAGHAVEVARRNPALCVGLHLTLCDGRGARISALTDARGAFAKSPAAAGVKIAFSARAKAELRGEIERQFSAFRALGFAPTYWDGHHHLHLHPDILEATIPIAVRYGFPFVRLVREPFPFLPVPLIFRALSRTAAPMLESAGIKFADRVYGLSGTGRMDETRIDRILRKLPDGISELYLHPGAEPDLPSPERLARLIDESGAQKSDALKLSCSGGNEESTPAHSPVSGGAS